MELCAVIWKVEASESPLLPGITILIPICSGTRVK
nr:MAG TPA: hypothetical protein [Caudoviricetes sp.]